MTGKQPDMTLKAIGFVHNEMKQPLREGWEEVISDIVIDDGLTEALDGLEEYSHIIVLYWLHKSDTARLATKVHPRGRPDLPMVGLFATRTPHRPNPIGKATVQLLERQGNLLRIRGLDAIDGTPVIDIKPYIPGYDSAANAKVPPWVTNL